MSVPAYCGCGGNALPTVNSAFTNFLPVMRNWKLRPNWNLYETSRGTFSASYLNNYVDILANNGLYYYIIMFVAPAQPTNWPNSNTPQYLFSSPDNVQLVATDQGNYYPYYFNTAYNNRRTNMRGTFLSQILAYTGDRLAFLLGVEEALGKTGDSSPYAGNPTNSIYNISDAQWDAYKQPDWSSEYSILVTAGKYFMINPGNDGRNYQWGLDNIPNVWMKPGELTHYYNNYGEIYAAQRFQAFRNSATNANRTGAENEGVINLSWWQTSPTQNTFYILASCAHCAVDMFHIAPTNALTDHTAYIWFNDRAGIRQASETTKGWCVFRDSLDVADLNRFPEATYDPLVAPSDQAAYNKKYNNIVNSGDPYYVIQDSLTNLLASGKAGNPFVNSSRISKILAANSGANYVPFNAALDSYNQDLGINMISGNYCFLLTQYNQFNTSKSYWRVGNVNDFRGRFGVGFDHANGKNEIYMIVDNGLASNNSYQVSIDIIFLDSGTNQWSLNYWNGTSKTNAGTVLNTNTNRERTVTFTIDDFFAGGNLSNGTDFTLKNENNTDTIFFTADIDIIAENPPPTGAIPSFVKLGNDVTTVCSQGDTTIYTDGAFAIGKITYTDDTLATPITGFDFLVRDSNHVIYNLNDTTGEITSQTTGICGGGLIGTFKAGNDLNTICANSTNNYYTTSGFATGSVVYADINLTTPLTGFEYIVNADNTIYAINSSTGLVGNSVGVCTVGAAGIVRVSNNVNDICNQDEMTVYIDDVNLQTGTTVYTDINLTMPLTGFAFIENTATGFIYLLNTDNGMVGNNLGITCNTEENVITPIDFTYNFQNSTDNYSRIIQSVVIDARKNLFPIGALGVTIDAKVKSLSNTASQSNVIFYSLTTKKGNIAGFFMIEVNGITASVINLVLRPVFMYDETNIVKQINFFLSSGSWQSDYIPTDM